MIGRPLFALVTCAALSTAALARPMDGRLGLGGQVDSGALGPTLSVKYWVSDLGLQGLFGFKAVPSSEDTVGAREYRFAARMLYALTRTRQTNLNVGVGFSMFIRDSAVDSQNPLWLDLLVSPEYHLNDNFAVSAQLTLSFKLGSSISYGTEAVGWGAGFHYYF